MAVLKKGREEVPRPSLGPRLGLGVGGVTHRSWPGGQGGKPRALVAGEGWRRGWMAVPKKGEGWVQTLEP